MRRIIFAVGLAALVLTVGCAASAQRDESGSIVDPGGLSVFSLRVGDCFDDPSSLGDDGAEIDSLDALPCAEPHDNEIFALFDHPADRDQPYPGDEEIEFFAFDRCLDHFRSYVGIDYDVSRLDVASITPTRGTWNDRDDREIGCMLYDIDYAKLTGSMRGARQ